MYAFIDLRTRSFLSKEPDEKDAVKQRAALERMLVRVHPTRWPENIVTCLHMDDATDMVDWTSPIIVGPKGGAAVISAAVAGSKAPDPTTAIKDAFGELQTKIAQLQNDFSSKLAKLHRDHQSNVLAVLKGRPTKGKPATVETAGYNSKGEWLEAGTEITDKKSKT
jgi:hypothetical protein